MNHRTARWTLAGTLVLVGACVLKTETVSGPQGEPGVIDQATLTDLLARLDALKARADAAEATASALQARVGADEAKIEAFDALEEQVAQLPVCGWFAPAHAGNCVVECQNFSQMALDAGWSRCAPRPSTGLNQPFGRQFYYQATCTSASVVTDGSYTYWETRFGHLVGSENTDKGDGSLFFEWNGCNDIVPEFWCCK